MSDVKQKNVDQYQPASKKKLSANKLKNLVEAALFVAEQPRSISALKHHELAAFNVSSKAIEQAIAALIADYQRRGVQLTEVASGYRFQANDEVNQLLVQAKQEKPAKYSRALLETLALIAYRQPITRNEIEHVRGVAVSSHIIKTLVEREWIIISGHKEVPGRPALYSTTKQFLDHFSLKSLEQLPELLSIADSAINEVAIHDILSPNNKLTKETET